MTRLVYPNIWYDLQDSPSARAELLDYVSHVVCWNDRGSPIRSSGADNLLGFVLDDYRMDEQIDELVGKIVFSDEAAALADFVKELRNFIDEVRTVDTRLSRIHECVAPDALVLSARRLLQRLNERGRPIFED
ncbi:MAG TPA: hypothetical protein VEW25_00890 [Allosphingosinicella sp.]|nr:hypothetical protein [Allosphingosinicella sp.]